MIVGTRIVNLFATADRALLASHAAKQLSWVPLTRSQFQIIIGRLIMDIMHSRLETHCSRVRQHMRYRAL